MDKLGSKMKEKERYDFTLPLIPILKIFPDMKLYSDDAHWPKSQVLTLKGVGGGKDLISPFPFVLTYVIDLSFLVSKKGSMTF